MLPVIAVDIGNTRAKFGYFSPLIDEKTVQGGVLAEPESFCACPTDDFADLFGWLHMVCPNDSPIQWRIACAASRDSVRSNASTWAECLWKLRVGRPRDDFKEMSFRNIPLVLDIEKPEMVGIDRLLAAQGAVAAWNSFVDTPRKTPFVLVVDAGTAITADLVSTQSTESDWGTFLGGAIFPGLGSAAAALAKISSRLPRIAMATLSDVSYPGKNTEKALASGLFFGGIGAILHLHTMAKRYAQSSIPVFLTGGDAEPLFRELSQHLDPSDVILLPHLALSAMVLTTLPSELDG